MWTILLPSAMAASEREFTRPLSDWRFGPAKYLITGAEDKQFKRLASDEERRDFIRGFWERRDPTPGTPENELREVFWRRVAEADRLFVESSAAGWSTDRGRIYVLLGPPDEQEVDPVQKGARGQIRWIYRGAPTRESGPHQIIAFREDLSGAWRLSSDPRDYSLVLDFVTRSSMVTSPFSAALESRRSDPGIPPGQLRLQLQSLERMPREEELVAAMVETRQEPGRFPFRQRFDYYRAAGGVTFVAVNLEMATSALPPGATPETLLPVARLEPVDPARDAVDFVYRNPFALAPPDPRADSGQPLVYQAGQGIRPGRYRTYVGLYDREQGEVAARRGEIQVPEFPPDTLSLSSVTLVRRWEPADEEEAAAAFKRPFVLAGRRVIPRLDTSYSNGETFAVYYQVYGAAADATGKPEMEVEYQVLAQREAGWFPVGDPIQGGTAREQAIGWSFPLQEWPLASFRLTVRIRDRIGGSVAEASVEFSVDG